MIKTSKPGKKSVELQPTARPSRIRRDPVRQAEAERLATDSWWESREWEIRFAVIGILLFAVALTLLSVGISEVTSH